ncbi:MAG: T9SS type A sorting domain-containing protein [Haliscomenobacter sp.]|nr:T9SS type A sorting domain-containing protein [Haliscomenobacter sp.]MBK9491460.1 T9SS type A sorting domain-containing protein [Haliscomenobacter sp.]
MSAKPNSLVNTDGRTTNGELIVETNNQSFEAGEEISVEFSAEQVAQIQGFQFTLDFDRHLLQLLDTENGELPQWSDGNLGTADLTNGLISTSWDNKGENVQDGRRKLFKLRFKALRDAELATALTLKEAPTPAEAYNQAGELMQVLLKVNESIKQPGEGVHLYQNYPNPFSSETAIGFTVPKRMNAQIRIVDAAGRLVFQQAGNYEKGYNEVKVPEQSLPAQGLYYYQLSTDSFTATKRMIYTTRR